MVNIVTIEGKRYMVDVGFGTNGATKPLPLVHGQVSAGIVPSERRLLWTSIQQHSDPAQRVWVFQYRDDYYSEWVDTYCFTELEFFPEDYKIMNLSTSQSRTSFFTYTVVCVKHLLAIEGDELVPVGMLIMFGGEVKRKVKGKTELLATCKSEAERIDALENWFDIHLSSKEKAGIRGTVTELKASG